MPVQPAFENLRIWWQSVDPLPLNWGTLQEATWRGKTQQFRVAWHEKRVYFTLAFDRGRYNHNSCATLDECEEQNAVECWKEALNSGRYGFCCDSHQTLRDCIDFPFQVIQAPDGSGLMREWWNHRWTPFAPPRGSSLMPLLEPVEQWPHILRRPPDCYEDLLLRRVSEEDSAQFSYRTSTNKREFQQVSSWLWVLRFIRIQQGHQHGWVRCRSEVFPFRGQFEVSHGLDWIGHPNLLLWLQSYFVVEGAQWKKSHYGRRKLRRLRSQEPRLRLFFEPHFANWICYFESGEEPSFHEQLEARLELRDWLLDKAPREQIESWLGSSS